MPPVQCPNCGRFLKNAFVASLAEAAAPCPGCEQQLRPEMFGEDPSGPLSPTERAEQELHHDPRPERGADEAPSVRPPDLEPADVRDDDVLRGWDAGEAVRAAGPSEDRAPFPIDTVVVAGAGVAGLLVGVALGRDRRVAAGAGGAAAGMLAGAVARRIWRLEP